MMRIIFVFFLFALFACSGKQKLPTGILYPDKMQKVLLDIMRADEYVSQFGSNDSLSTDAQKRESLYQKILTANSVTQIDFKKSFYFYQSRPDLLKPVLDSLYKKADVQAPVKPFNFMKGK